MVHRPDLPGTLSACGNGGGRSRARKPQPATALVRHLPRRRRPEASLLAARRASRPHRDQALTRVAVWGATLRCNLAMAIVVRCAGKARGTRKLSTEECLALVGSRRTPVQEVSLIGGEAHLHPGFPCGAPCAEGTRHRMGMTTGGGVASTATMRRGDAGLDSVSDPSTASGGARHAPRAARFPSRARSARCGVRDAGVFVSIQHEINHARISWSSRAPQAPHRARAKAFQIAHRRDGARGRCQSCFNHYEASRGVSDHRGPQAPAAAGGRADVAEVTASASGRTRRSSGADAARTLLLMWRRGRDPRHQADGTIEDCPSLPTTAWAGGNVREHSLRTRSGTVASAALSGTGPRRSGDSAAPAATPTNAAPARGRRSACYSRPGNNPPVVSSSRPRFSRVTAALRAARDAFRLRHGESRSTSEHSG